MAFRPWVVRSQKREPGFMHEQYDSSLCQVPSVWEAQRLLKSQIALHSPLTPPSPVP